MTPIEPAFVVALRDARQGCERAWTAIYADISPALHAYLLVRGAREPEDLLGETFTQIARDISRFSGGYTEFRSWTFIVAHHRLADERRRTARRPVEPAGDSVPDTPDPTADTEGDVVESTEWAWIAELLADLTDDQRNIVLLRAMAGLRVNEIADAVGKPPGTVRMIHDRAMTAIRQTLTAVTG